MGCFHTHSPPVLIAVGCLHTHSSAVLTVVGCLHILSPAVLTVVGCFNTQTLTRLTFSGEVLFSAHKRSPAFLQWWSAFIHKHSPSFFTIMGCFHTQTLTHLLFIGGVRDFTHNRLRTSASNRHSCVAFRRWEISAWTRTCYSCAKTTWWATGSLAPPPTDTATPGQQTAINTRRQWGLQWSDGGKTSLQHGEQICPWETWKLLLGGKKWVPVDYFVA